MMRKYIKHQSIACIACLPVLALIWGCNSKKSGKVYFGNLTDGDLVVSPVEIEMKAENRVVEPASNGVNLGKGHFHILVDQPMVLAPNPIPKDAQHIHFGKGDTAVILELSPGPHTLTLRFAKGDHVSYDPPIFQEIHVEVLASAAASLIADSSAPAESTKTITP